MKIIKFRFFNNILTNKYSVEKIDWVLAGTECVAIDDPRCVSIGELRNNPISGLPGFDLWLPVSISNCACDISVLHTYNMETQIAIDENGLAIEVQEATSVISYSPMDIYNMPLMANLVEVTMAEYNAGIIA